MTDKPEPYRGRALTREDEERLLAERPEVVMVKFMGRLMSGYEDMADRVLRAAELSNDRAAMLEKALTRHTELQLQMRESYEEMLSLQEERKQKAATAENDREMKKALTGDLRALGNLVVKKWAGIPLTGKDSHGLQDLLTTFTPEQFDAAMSGTVTLTDAQRELLVGILQSLGGPSEEKPQAAE